MPHLEFLGAPGSGKTSLATATVLSLDRARSLENGVLHAIRSEGQDPVTRAFARLVRSSDTRLWRIAYSRSTDRFAALGRFLEAHPETLPSVLAAQHERRGRDLRPDLALSWILNLMARFQLATESGGDDRWLVMDEGFIQRGVALVGSGFVDMDVPLLSRYLAAAPMPDVVVVVATPPEACAARLDRRGWSERVSGLTPAQRGAFLAGAIDVVERVTETLATGPVRIIRVDGTRPIADSTRSLAATLTS